MCGVLFLHGPAAIARMSEGLRRLRHRGPDGASIWSSGQTCLGFNRLAITDKGEAGQQPLVNGDLVAAINGEIYNHEELKSRYGLSLGGPCDTRVVLPLFKRLGECAIDELDGFYSGIIFSGRTQELLCLRDHMGKKPLLLGKSGTELFVTSELKALDEIQWFQSLPKGLSRVNVDTGAIEVVRAHGAHECRGTLRQVVTDAVAKRLPRDGEPLGLFLSGGLESSIIAALAAPARPDAVCYTLGDAHAPDHRLSELVMGAFRLRSVRSIVPPAPAEMPRLVEAVVQATESFNPSVISNGLCTWLLSRAAHEDGIKVVLTGEGADELFCGYHQFSPDDPWRETRARLIDDMQFTELRRLDSCSMAHAVEARCPFLDRAVRSHSDQLVYEDLYEMQGARRQNKMALRRAFADILPPAVLQQSKTSFDVGSGVRGLVVDHLRAGGSTERAALERIWRRHFAHDARQPYFHAYPVFDRAIDSRGASHR